MKSTEYLYGIKPQELENKFYKEALQYKLESGKRLFSKLYFNRNRTQDEDVQYFHVGNAVKFTEALLVEIE